MKICNFVSKEKFTMDELQLPDESGLERGITNYSNATWLRTTVIGAAGAIGIVFPVIPAAVGALDVAITTKAQKIAERRLNQLCQSWESEMKQIPVQFVDKDYIESEEFFDLIFKAWESTKRTRHDEKIHLYAKSSHAIGADAKSNRTFTRRLSFDFVGTEHE